MNQPAPEIGRVRLITAGTHDTPLYVYCGTILPIWTPEHLLTPDACLNPTTGPHTHPGAPINQPPTAPL